MQAFDRSHLGFSTACCAGKSLAEAFQIGHDMGFATCEILAFDGYYHSQGKLSGFYFEHMTPAQREELRELASGFTHLSTHAPFIDMHPFAPSPSIRDVCRRQLEIAVDAIAYLGGSTTTTHVVPKHTLPLAEFKQEVVDQNHLLLIIFWHIKGSNLLLWRQKVMN